MMTIRRAQFEEIGRRLARRWEDTMVIHLETFFPERAAELGPKGVADAIDLGVKKAAKYNIHTERDVCKFLNFMFVYGFDFDTDPELPWAHEILTNEALVRSNVKMYLLEKAAYGELEPPLETVALPTQEEMDAALAEARERDRAEIEAARIDPPETGDGDGTTGDQ